MAPSPRSLLSSRLWSSSLLALVLLLLTAGCGRAIVSEPVDESGAIAGAPAEQEGEEGSSENEPGDDAAADEGDGADEAEAGDTEEEGDDAGADEGDEEAAAGDDGDEDTAGEEGEAEDEDGESTDDGASDADEAADDAGADAGASDSSPDGFMTTRQMRQLGEVTFHFTTVPGKGGETKVIDVSAANGFFQRIVPPDYPEPMGGADDPLFLVAEDMDFDDTDDFRVMQMIPATAIFPYYYWLWQPGLDQFAYHEPYESLGSPVFEDYRIKAPFRAGAALWGEDTFMVFEDVPELERKEQWEVEVDTPEGMARHRVWEYDYANGTEELTVDEVVPIP